MAKKDGKAKAKTSKKSPNIKKPAKAVSPKKPTPKAPAKSKKDLASTKSASRIKMPHKAVSEALKVAPQPSKKSLRQGLESVKGMHDILPKDQPYWEKMRDEVRCAAYFYNFSRIDTPIVEHAALFERGAGETSEIVEKQMYFLKTEDKLVLRPENTASVARAYIEHGMSHEPQPVRLYYFAPMFRYEQPQEGRFRSFHQAGFEILGGESDPIYDAEIILTTFRLLESLKLSNLSIEINTLGSPFDRAIYRRKLVDFLKNKKLSKEVHAKLDTNPLRILDSKDESVKEILKTAPSILDSLSASSSAHFKAVLEYLDTLGLPYTISNNLVRGLDYYSHTVFEIFSSDFNFALAAGGRYDGLVELLGGRKTPAVGSAIGLERIVHVMKAAGIDFNNKNKPKVFLIHVGDLAKKKSLALLETLKNANIYCKEALSKDSLKAQLKQADKEGSHLALIMGQKEAFEESVIIRDLESGIQETVPIDKLIEKLHHFLKS
ncbi:MAG: histidine--tRNA ligase [Candidatus Harrisonbacteria bacterium]|nr:histidine--tRNA ligase [Candidatus Harrisonbacteria bacterium]